jgi:hypothetical protein
MGVMFVAAVAMFAPPTPRPCDQATASDMVTVKSSGVVSVRDAIDTAAALPDCLRYAMQTCWSHPLRCHICLRRWFTRALVTGSPLAQYIASHQFQRTAQYAQLQRFVDELIQTAKDSSVEAGTGVEDAEDQASSGSDDADRDRHTDSDGHSVDSDPTDSSDEAGAGEDTN